MVGARPADQAVAFRCIVITAALLELSVATNTARTSPPVLSHQRRGIIATPYLSPAIWIAHTETIRVWLIR